MPERGLKFADGGRCVTLRRTTRLFQLSLLVLMLTAPLSGQTEIARRDVRSKNFLLHTDITEDESTELVKRLETMLSIISRYWQRPNRQIIECYVIRNPDEWPAGEIHPSGLYAIKNKTGLTLAEGWTSGGITRRKAIVYAYPDGGLPQHEAVHAYCAQEFGTNGPVWYSEGMAEMGAYWVDDDPTVTCPPHVVRYLKESDPRSLRELVDRDQQTGDSWQNYAWRWSICHLLANNTNYSARFRPLGMGLLTRQRGASFERSYGSMTKELEFEYGFFLRHMERGYDVGRCSWDWKTKSRRLRGRNKAKSRIRADQGWQATRANLEQDVDYSFETNGKWKLAKEATELTADGDPDGSGQLVGIVYHDYALTEPFALGSGGLFTAPASGHLFVRCDDKWNELGDNEGTIGLTITRDASMPSDQ